MNIYEYTLSELEELFVSLGYKKFNAGQVYDWIYKKRIKNFDEMTNVKKELIEYMNEHFVMGSIDVIDRQDDKDVSKFMIIITI